MNGSFAPEKIWAYHNGNSQTYLTVPNKFHSVEYTRSDLVAELAAENERLKLEVENWKTSAAVFSAFRQYLFQPGPHQTNEGGWNIIEAKVRRILASHQRDTNTVEDHKTGSVEDKPALTEGDKSIRWIPSASTMEGIMSGRLNVGDKLIPEGQQEPVAWGEFYGGKIAAVRTDKSRHCTVPLFTRPSEQMAAWEDREDDMSAAILESHPVRSKSYSTYEQAMELVSNRHSKGALVMLVNHLLIQAETRPSEQAVTDEMVDAACRAHWFGEWPGDRPENILDARRHDMRNALKAAMEVGR